MIKNSISSKLNYNICQAHAGIADSDEKFEEVVGTEEECLEFVKEYVAKHQDQKDQIAGGIIWIDLDQFVDIYKGEGDVAFQLGDWAVWFNEPDEDGVRDISGNNDWLIDEVTKLFE